MRTRTDPRIENATFCRSYFVTFGLILAAFGVASLLDSGWEPATWPWLRIVFAAFLPGGVGLILVGLLGPSAKMQEWAETAARHEGSLIILVLAYPVSLVLSLFYDRR